MKAFAAAFILLLLSSGCTTYHDSGAVANETGFNEQSFQAEITVADSPADYSGISIAGISIEKNVYHSAEVMRFNVTLLSDIAAEGLELKAYGINGKMSIVKAVDMVPGENLFSLEYTLPRCNVCGGITPGNYTFEVSVYNSDIIDSDTISVEILQ
ncbi:MAG: hypothetical protein JW789_00850 [Candidatus Aenigmarchaeota archaeon]|nr:hypothetical protein [Candidatus Aenigmarchaeota archaeon]